MQYKAGDSIVHPVYGVGNILRLEEKRLAEDRLRWYYVVTADKSTIWVPVDEAGAAGLRDVTLKRDLDQYRCVLQGRPALLDRDHHKRRLEIHERVKRGSFQSLCEVVRDLSALAWNKPLGENDSSSLKRLQASLCREWAVAADISIPEATAEVQALLLAAWQAYKA
jgi:RNA polymerase-interacting CarD/CdnL/TRCF family regulator